MVVVVLLKDGNLEAVTCHSRDVFRLARAREAGICGIFDDPENAEAYIQALRQEQKRNRWNTRQSAFTHKQTNG